MKFNVIIPTRERAVTLYHSLRTIVAQDYENLNIIVSDNFSQDHTKEIVTSFSDSRIKYINTGKRLSMSHNWEFALSHVSDGWVMFLGDDDGLYPGAIGILNELIQEFNVEAVSSEYGFFKWPGHFENYSQGTLEIPLSSSVKIKDSRVAFDRVLSGTLDYTRLPWLYHGGGASIELINRLRDKNGRFFCSQIPDLYSAIAFSLATDRYLSVGIPIAINGASKYSTGSSQFYATSELEMKPAKKFDEEANIPFHELLIFGRSIHIFIYESYLQAQHIHNGDPNLLLEDRLQLAAKSAPVDKAEEILQLCKAIAVKNGFVFIPRYSRWLFKIRMLPSVLNLRLQRLVIDPTKLNIDNIYDATLASSYIIKFLKSDSLRSKIFVIVNSFNALFLIIASVYEKIIRAKRYNSDKAK